MTSKTPPVTPFPSSATAQREAMVQKALQLAAQGICPTCRHFETGDVYPPVGYRTFYENELAVCMLEQYPRNPGHAVLLVKPHYEDISQLPPQVGARLVPLIHAMVASLKAVLEAEKIYVCTMCDGLRSHLHLQFIPRLVGDETRGSRLFVKQRGVLTDPAELIARLREEMPRRVMQT
jgi:histidine triad (HIT) family protein